MDWGMFAAIAAVIGIQTGLLLWMISKLDADVRSVSADIKGAHIRIDAMGARIDQTQSIIMRMLEKQGR